MSQSGLFGRGVSGPAFAHLAAAQTLVEKCGAVAQQLS
jgi:hypothetical protein